MLKFALPIPFSFGAPAQGVIELIGVNAIGEHFHFGGRRSVTYLQSRVALVESNTGNLHRVNVKESSCGCKDAQRNSDYRDCKHVTVCRAVVNHHRAKKAAENAAREAIVEEKFRRNRERLAAYIERERTSPRLAA